MPEGGRLVVDVGETTIGIFRVDGNLYAYLNKCAHQGGPVCQGKIIPRVNEVIDGAAKATDSLSTRRTRISSARGTASNTTSRRACIRGGRRPA